MKKGIEKYEAFTETCSKQETSSRSSWIVAVGRDMLRTRLCHSLSVITRLIRVAHKVKYEPNIISLHHGPRLMAHGSWCVCTSLYVLREMCDTIPFEKFNPKNFCCTLSQVSRNRRNEPTELSTSRAKIKKNIRPFGMMYCIFFLFVLSHFRLLLFTIYIVFVGIAAILFCTLSFGRHEHTERA